MNNVKVIEKSLGNIIATPNLSQDYKNWWIFRYNSKNVSNERRDAQRISRSFPWIQPTEILITHSSIKPDM